MPSSPLETADAELREAHDAHAERARLQRLHDALAPDLIEAEREVADRERAFAAEHRDVKRYEQGLWAFLYDIVADREARLTKEQGEAAVAELRLTDARTVRDRLAEQLASLASRLAALGEVDARLAAARTAKATALLSAGGAVADQLAQINAELDKLAPMRRELDEAHAAGVRAHGALTQLAQVLASARSWGQADLLTDNVLISWTKRGKLDEARRFAGLAEAELMVFSGELGDLGMSLGSQVTRVAGRYRFLDTWFDNILIDWDVQRGIRQAQAATDATLAVVGARIDELRRTVEGIGHQADACWKRRLEILGSGSTR